MESLSILIFNWRCWLNPAMGGAEVFTYEVAKRWVKAGHKVTLFTSEFPNCRREELWMGLELLGMVESTRFIGRLKKLLEEVLFKAVSLRALSYRLIVGFDC